MSTSVTLLANNAGAEWLRVWSVRTSWLFVVAGVFGVTGLATLAGASSGASAPPGGSPWRLAGIFGLLALFALLVFATVVAAADHGTKSIIPTLQWTPQRPLLLAVRVGVITITTTVIGVLLIGTAGIILWAFAPQLTFLSAEAGAVLAQAALVYSAGAMLSVGIALLTRNTAAALSAVFALMLVLPLILQLFPYDWMVRITEVLPGSGAFFFLLGEGPGDTRMTGASAAITLVVWAVSALALGAWRLLRRDAT